MLINSFYTLLFIATYLSLVIYVMTSEFELENYFMDISENKIIKYIHNLLYIRYPIVLFSIINSILVLICYINSCNFINYFFILVYIFFRFCIKSSSKKNVYIDFCLVPIICVILIGSRDYQQSGSISTSVAILKNTSNRNSMVSYEDQKTLWEFLTPYIAACVGWVTFWAFWAQLKANEIASKDSKKTSIENTFFQMLAIHRENLNDITIEIKSKSYNGKKAVSKLCHEFLQKKSTHFEDWYKTFYDSNQCKSSLATYFYHLYRIVKYIDSQEVLAPSEKQDYMKNLRAQMSREEQTLLFHNWLAGYLLYASNNNNNEEYGYRWETYKQPYLSRYNLIVHLEPNMLLQSARTFVSDNTWNKKVNDLKFEDFKNVFSDYGISKNDQIKKVMKILFKHYQ